MTKVSDDTKVNKVSPVSTHRIPVDVSATGAPSYVELGELKSIKTGMEIIAHRGFVSSYPQNTMLAMSGALESGADSLECDVQTSSTGTLYLFHDTTVDALTDGTGTFTALSDATIDALVFDEVVGTDYADEGVPTFDAFLEYASQKQIRIYPEIKSVGSDADIDAIVSAIVSYGMEELCTLQSFTASNLDRVRTTNSVIKVGLLGSSTTQATYEANIDYLKDIGRGELLWSYTALISTPAIVDYAKLNGVDIATWTVGNMTDIHDLMELGVTRFMVDVLRTVSSKDRGLPILTSTPQDIQEITAGTGAVTVTGELANINDPDTSSSAYLLKRLTGFGGETITLSCRARLISGSGDTAPALAIDYPAQGSLKNKIHFDSPHWKNYSISYTIPLTHVEGSTDHVRCVAGGWTSLIGEADIKDFKVHVSESKFPVARIWGQALVQIASGVPTLNTNYSQSGIKSLSYSAGTKILTVNVAASGASSIRFSPNFFLQLTSDTNLSLVAKHTGYNRTTGDLSITFIDMSLAVPVAVDITGLGTVYMHIMAVT